jgi:ribose 5-phosphate isomerase A
VFAPPIAAEAVEAEKRIAARAAVGEVRSGMLLGLGTGSTVRHFLEALAESLRAKALEGIRGVPTSIDTERRCAALGIPTLDLAEGLVLDVAIDGADEVSPALDLIKGLGGALLREKMVVQASRRFVVIADAAKEVRRLGSRAPVPVEVAPFGWRTHLPFFRSLGAEPRPRKTPGGDLVVTDNGNHLIDLSFESGIESPDELEAALRGRAGVLETGLFLGMADRAFVGDSGDVRVRDRGGS